MLIQPTTEYTIFNSMDLLDCLADYYEQQQESIRESDQDDWDGLEEDKQ
jgi:hypothetical protein